MFLDYDQVILYIYAIKTIFLSTIFTKVLSIDPQR